MNVELYEPKLYFLEYVLIVVLTSSTNKKNWCGVNSNRIAIKQYDSIIDNNEHENSSQIIKKCITNFEQYHLMFLVRQ